MYILFVLSTIHKNQFSTTRRNLMSTYFLYLLDCLIEEFLVDIPWGKFELVFASRMNQSGRQNQELPVQCLQGGIAPFSCQTKSPEPVDQIVTQKSKMKMNLVGQKTVGRNFAKRKAFFELSNIQLDSRPLFVKMPNSFWRQNKIAYKNLIKVISVLPEPQLKFFFLAFWFGATNYDKTMWPFPSVRLVSKLSCLPSAFSESMVAKRLNLLFDRSCHVGYDSVFYSLRVEKLDKFVVVKSRIGSHSYTVKIFGNFLFYSRPESRGNRYWLSVSWTQDSIPRISSMPFETKHRIITGTKTLCRIVANLGSLNLPTENR